VSGQRATEAEIQRVERQLAAPTATLVRKAIRDALADFSTDSAVIETRDGDLGLVLFDDSEAFIVKIEAAALMVLEEAEVP
jgi:hypothetical protein